MIHYIDSGILFDSQANALVNPVNSKGFMGKGLALEFSKRFPEILPPYKKACSSGELRPGALMLVHLAVLIGTNQVYTAPQFSLREIHQLAISDGTRPSQLNLNRLPDTSRDSLEKKRPAIILFPTKDDWRFRSRVEWIDWGLATLRSFYQQWGLKSIAMPQLGCGLGGLEWPHVKRLIERHFADEPVEIEVYLSAVKAFGERREPASGDHRESFYKSLDKESIGVRDKGVS